MQHEESPTLKVLETAPITAYGNAETNRKALKASTKAPFAKPIDFGTLRGEIDMRV